MVLIGYGTNKTILYYIKQWSQKKNYAPISTKLLSFTNYPYILNAFQILSIVSFESFYVTKIYI